MVKCTPRKARRVIRTLRSGTVTPEVAELISVGTKAVENEFHSRANKFLLKGAQGDCILLKGDWGCGKSHIRMLLCRKTSNSNIPYIDDCVDGRAGSLAHLHRCIPRWFTRLHIGNIIGLRSIINFNKIDNVKVSNWCIKNHNLFADNLHYALMGYPWGWFMALGHGYHTPDYSYQHPKARALFLSLVAMIHALGKGGIVLFLDEAENISRQHDIRGRRKTYDTLGRLKNHPRILPFLFITDRFFVQIKEDFVRAHYENNSLWSDYSLYFLNNIFKEKVLNTPEIDNKMGISLLKRIAYFYSIGYDMRGKTFPTKSIIELWEKASTRPVRLLIRIAIHQLDLIRLYAL